MATEIRVPTLGESVVEATIGRWLKQVGERVSVGEPLVELETDKVNTELPADEAGVLESILRREGETVRPGDPLGVIGVGDGTEAAPSEAPAGRGTEVASAAPAAAAGEQSAAQEENGRVRASPLAERVAEELHVDLSRVPPSAPGGRVTREDVQAFAGRDREPAPPRTEVQVPAQRPRPAAPAPPAASSFAPPTAGARPEKREKLSRRRQTIARRLVEAQQAAAMLTTFNEVDMSAIMAVRARRRDSFREQHGVGLGYMSFFTRAAVGALKAFPRVNSELEGDDLVLKGYYDIGIAVGDPEGLVVPVVRDADRLTFAQVEQAIASFAQKAKDRALTAEDLRGGTFTISNGGVYGSLLSTPILNAPQVAILGMHKIEERPVAVKGEVVVRPMMYLALTYDHRVVDGREAVLFLARIKDLLEDPERLLLEA